MSLQDGGRQGSCDAAVLFERRAIQIGDDCAGNADRPIEPSRQIHEHCVEHGYVEDGWVDYVRGANVAGFLKVAEAMLALGLV